jgi:RNA polymerase sigma-70 factor, ECF subfamily
MNSGEQTDHSIIKAVQAGDRDLFSCLLDRHLPAIHAFIALKLPVPHLVDDLAHETFVFAYRNLHQFTPGTSLRAWLRAIAANKVRAEIERFCREQKNQLNYLDHRLVQCAASDVQEDTAPEVAAMQACLEELPDHSRKLLALKYEESCSADDMARRIARTVPWVRTTLFRIREQLRSCIETRMKGESS